MPLRRLFITAILLAVGPGAIPAFCQAAVPDPPSAQPTEPRDPSGYPLTHKQLDNLMRQAETASHDQRLTALAELCLHQLALPVMAGRMRKLLDDPAADIAQGAAHALSRMRGAAIPQLVDAMKSRDGYTRRLAVAALADPYMNGYGNRQTLVKELSHVLDDPDPLLRRAAVTTLCALLPRTDPILIGAMKGDDLVKLAAADQLLAKRVGDSPQPSLVPSRYYLTQAYLDELMLKAETGTHDQQISALWEIARYELSIPDIARRVRKLLDDPAADISQAAADALGTMRDAAIPQFLDAMQSRDGYTRRLAVTALADPYLNAYRNKETLVKEIAHVLADPDPLLRRAAVGTLCALLPQSEPILTLTMKGGDDAVRMAVVDQLIANAGQRPSNSASSPPSGATPPIDERFADFEAQVAGELLQRMNSKDAVEAEHAFEAMRALRSSKSRDQLVGKLIHEMEDETLGSNQRSEAGIRAGLLANEFVPAWIDGLRSKDAYTRQRCVQIMANQMQFTTDRNATAALIRALGDPIPDVRYQAIRWARYFPQPPPGVIDKLAGWLTPGNDLYDKNAGDRYLAAELLEKWAAEPKVSVPALIHALEDGQPQFTAVLALRKFGADAGPAIPRLAALLKNDKPKFRELVRASAETLLELGPEGRAAAVGYLSDTLRFERDPQSQLWAVRALAAVGPQAAAAAAILTDRLADSSRELRIEIARALGEIGPPAHEALVPLSRMVDNINPDVRQAASEALLKIAPTGKGLGPALIAAVLNRDRVCVESLASALQRSGEVRPYVLRLTDLASDDPDTVVRATAHRAVELLAGR